jgi:hypothetical protein
MVDLFDHEDNFYRVKVRFLPQLSIRQHSSKVDREVIEREVCLDEEIRKKIIWPHLGRSITALALLGSESYSLHGKTVCPESIGAQDFFVSTDMRLMWLPWTVDSVRKYIFVGIPGIDKARLTTEIKGKYPSFSVPSSWSNLTKIPEERRIDVTSITDDQNVFSVEINSETDDEGKPLDVIEACVVDNGVDDIGTNLMNIDTDDDFIRYVTIKINYFINFEQRMERDTLSNFYYFVIFHAFNFLGVKRVCCNNVNSFCLTWNISMELLGKNKIIAQSHFMSSFYQREHVYICNNFAILCSEYRVGESSFKRDILHLFKELHSVISGLWPEQFMTKYENSISIAKIFAIVLFYIATVIATSYNSAMGNGVGVELRAGDKSWFTDPELRKEITYNGYVKSNFLELMAERFYKETQSSIDNASDERESNSYLIYLLLILCSGLVICIVSSLISTYKFRKIKAEADKVNNERLQTVWNMMQNQPLRDVRKFSAPSVCGPVSSAIELEDSMSSVSQHQGRDVESGTLMQGQGRWTQPPGRLPV